MPLQDGIEEVVSLMTSYFLDGGKELAADYGDQAPALATEMAAIIEERLSTDSPFGQMWAEYKQNIECLDTSVEPNETEEE